MLIQSDSAPVNKLISNELANQLTSEMMIDLKEVNRIKTSMEFLFICYLESQKADDTEERIKYIRDYQSIIILLNHL